MSRVDRLRVISPCTQSWDSMAGDERTRFCAECQKHVVDIAALSRTQVERLIDNTKGNFCARITRLPDGRVKTAANPNALKPRLTRWLSGIAFAASTVMAADERGARIRTLDPSGAVLPNAEVKLIRRQDRSAPQASTNSSGEVTFSNIPNGDYLVEVTAPGFAALVTGPFRVESDKLVSRDVTLQVGESTMGLLLVEQKPSLLRRVFRRP